MRFGSKAVVTTWPRSGRCAVHASPRLRINPDLRELVGAAMNGGRKEPNRG